MKEPNITVLCNQPSNGYLALVFTDEGMVMTSRCKVPDAYDGLVKAVSDLLLDCVDDVLSKHKKDQDEDEAEVYAAAMAVVHKSFSKSVQERMAVALTERRLQESGLSPMFAAMLAEGMHKLPGDFFKVDTDDEEMDDEE